MRIWYQSFVDPGEHRPYLARLSEYVNEISAENVDVAVVGMSPSAAEMGRLTEFRCACDAVRNATVAERDGFDAYLLGHFQDSGLYEARSAVDIPVIGLGESSMLFACSLGRRIGVVSIHPLFVPIHEEQIARYGLADRISVTAMELDADELVAAFADEARYAEIRREFVARARPLVANGIEVLMSAGGLFALLSAHEENFTIDGAVVLNSIVAAVKQAEAAMEVHRLTGISASRAASFALPSQRALRQFASHTPGHVIVS